MDALVHHGAPAVEGERAAPGGGIVIGLRAPPRDERAGHRQLAEAAGVERRFQRDRARAEAALRPGDGEPRRVALATPDLSALLPIARMPLAERRDALAALSNDVPSRSVTLTLDGELQAALAPLVRAAAKKGAVGAAALVVMDPATGQMLARVQWPDYDPGGPDWRMKRLAEEPAFMGIYGAWSDKTGAHGVWQAGSVFKLLTATAAVKAGKVTTDVEGCPVSTEPTFPCDEIDDGRPSFTLPGWTKPIHDHGDGGAHGKLDLVAAITRSSNVYFGQLALAIGPEPYRQLRSLGVEFGNPGLDQEPDGEFKIGRAHV